MRIQLSIQPCGILSCRVYRAVLTLQMRSSTALNLVSLAANLLLGGCAPAPSIAVFGAAFPDWLFCIAFGVLGTVVVHAVLGKQGKRAALAPLALSYPALCALLAMAFWLMVFSH
ncbi:YtcA family lipoprotein [Paraburkholderia sp. EG287A]|uniref:YtcA family lipoprotein n=1 Tax=unclassified Paraburkholderia TaxID=2615204 RepID=UPI0034D1D7AC